MLPEIVYNIKKELGCIFVENHDSESMVLKRGQTVGLMTLVMQEEQGQLPAERSDEMQSIMGTSNDMGTSKGGTT